VFAATLSSTVAGSNTVTATIGSFTDSATVTFTAGALSQGNSSLTAAPPSLIAGSTTTLTVVARDAHGNPLVGQSVSLSGSGGLNVFNPRRARSIRQVSSWRRCRRRSHKARP